MFSKTTHAFLIGIFLLAGCIDPSSTDPAINFPRQVLTENTLTINLNDESTPDNGFFVYCSGGASCENPSALRIFQYRDQVEYTDQHLNYSLFFEPALSNNYSLESVREKFSNAIVTMKFPGNSDSFYDWTFYNNDIKTVEFQKYENNILTGQIEFFINNIRRQKKDFRCQVADTTPPGDCSETKPFEKTVKIQFELTVNPAQR